MPFFSKVANVAKSLLRLDPIALLLAALLMVVGTAARGDDISGSYVAKAGNAAFLIQLVQTEGGHLTGRYEQAQLLPSGKVDSLNAAITGASNGQMVVVTLQPNQFFAVALTISGTLKDGQLHLSGGDNDRRLDLDLTKSDESTYRAAVDALADERRRIADARTRADEDRRRVEVVAERTASIGELAKQMSAFVQKADAALPNFSPTEARIRAITERMRQALARQRSIYGSVQASVARTQISVAITQASIGANQIHIDVQASFQDFDASSGQLLQESTDASLICRGAHPPTEANPVAPGQIALNATCVRFLESSKKFQQRLASLKTAFEEIEGVWVQERREQDAILQASSNAT